MIDPALLAIIRKEYPMKLRRCQAVSLARRCGVSEHCFRILVGSKQITPQKLIGVRAHYDREQIVSILAQ